MSIKLPDNGPNPFLQLSQWVGDKAARQNRDAHQEMNIHHALAIHAANHAATTQAAAQTAKLSEKSEVGRSKRAMAWADEIHNRAEPGQPVSLRHGEIQASYTPKIPTPTKPPAPGRVPVKKNRGGKKNR
jgi:hypothetical protein